MPATVCVDGFNLALAKGSGIATYGRNLVSTLDVMGMRTQVLYGPLSRIGADPLLDEVALVDHDRAGPKPTRSERYLMTLQARFGLRASFIANTDRIIWPDDGAHSPQASGYWASRDIYRTANRAFARYGSLTRVNFANAAEAPDIVHWTAPLPLLASRAINIHTIHDLIPLRLPLATLEYKARYLELARRLADRSDHLVVVSETTRRDVIELLGVPENKVTNTYQVATLPPSHNEKSDSDVAADLDAAFGLEWKSYFLHYGAIEPKKNLGRIVEAYLSSRSLAPLIIVGSKGWLDEPETALLHAAQHMGSAKKRIHQFEYLPASVLTSLIRGARATLFPSLYEGFGLPVLESMLAGTAVLTSTTGSLPEIAGDAAVLVDPTDVASIAAGIRMLDHDSDLRESLVIKGRLRAKLYSTQAYQARLTGLYKQLGVDP